MLPHNYQPNVSLIQDLKGKVNVWLITLWKEIEAQVTLLNGPFKTCVIVKSLLA